METDILEMITAEPAIAEQNAGIQEVADLQLAFVGGGIGNVIVA